MVPFFIYTGIILTLPFIFSSPETTVVLLDNNKSTNSIIVTTQGGSVTLDQPYTQTTLSSPDASPHSPSAVDEAHVREKYGRTIEALPLVPVSVLFYFEEGTARLTPESAAQSASLVELIRSREPCVVDIIGHTDTQGNAEGNDRLGLERARMVKSFLEERRVEMKEVSVTSHGEGDLLVPTGDGIDEPRNRRVEVIVR